MSDHEVKGVWSRRGGRFTLLLRPDHSRYSLTQGPGGRLGRVVGRETRTPRVTVVDAGDDPGPPVSLRGIPDQEVFEGVEVPKKVVFRFPGGSYSHRWDSGPGCPSVLGPPDRTGGERGTLYAPFLSLYLHRGQGGRCVGNRLDYFLDVGEVLVTGGATQGSVQGVSSGPAPIPLTPTLGPTRTNTPPYSYRFPVPPAPVSSSYPQDRPVPQSCD